MLPQCGCAWPCRMWPCLWLGPVAEQAESHHHRHARLTVCKTDKQISQPSRPEGESIQESRPPDDVSIPWIIASPACEIFPLYSAPVVDFGAHGAFLT